MNQILESSALAMRDWKFEFLISICSVVALASMLTPLMVLLGLKNGIIEGLKSRLLEDPAVLIILPKSDAGKFSNADIRQFAELNGAKYAVGRTRDTSTDITLTNQKAI